MILLIMTLEEEKNTSPIKTLWVSTTMTQIEYSANVGLLQNIFHNKGAISMSRILYLRIINKLITRFTYNHLLLTL